MSTFQVFRRGLGAGWGDLEGALPLYLGVRLHGVFEKKKRLSLLNHLSGPAGRKEEPERSGVGPTCTEIGEWWGSVAEPQLWGLGMRCAVVSSDRAFSWGRELGEEAKERIVSWGSLMLQTGIKNHRGVGDPGG